MRAQGTATSRNLRPVSTAHDGVVTGNNSPRENAHAAYEFGKTLRSWVWASRLAARQDYFQSGAVSIFDRRSDGLRAKVQGSERSPYRVALDWSRAETESAARGLLVSAF